MKEATLKILPATRFYLCNVLEKKERQGQKAKQWWRESWGGSCRTGVGENLGANGDVLSGPCGHAARAPIHTHRSVY